MIKAIVFDFDEMILIEGDYFSNYIIKKHNLSKEIKTFFTNEFPLCRTGILDTKDALSPYLTRCGYINGYEDFMEEWRKFGTIDEDLFSIIEATKKKGIICVLATNNESYRMSYFIKKYNLKEHFDKLFLSYEIGFLKPQKEFLEKMLKELSVPKEAILFCDDKQSFIDAAKEFGLKTHLYTNKEELKRTLEQESFSNKEKDNS